MDQPVRFDRSTDLAHFCSSPGLPALDPGIVERQRPDACWASANASGALTARCSLWWSRPPSYPGQRVGLLGHYAAAEPLAARQLLQLACAELAARGCTLVVGPVDGNTWQSYRLVTERGDEPPFFLEPDTPASWPLHFLEAGFSPLAHYSSALNGDLSDSDQRVASFEQRLAGMGIRLRSFDAGRWREELSQLYQVALHSFRQNLLFSPIDEADFVAQYAPLQQLVRPELVLLAEHEGRVVGFMFALPDLLQARRGLPIDTLILKTLAVLPEYSGLGLGSLLIARCQEAGARLGFRRAIYALMHDSNHSRRISRHYARTIRRYALFAREVRA